MKLPKFKSNIRKNGFSLVELLIVISIIGIMSGIGLSVSNAVQKNTRDAQRESDLRVLQSALQQYYADQNKYPTSMPILSTGNSFTNCTGFAGSCPTVTKTYLNSVPKDPSGTSYYYNSYKNINNLVSCDNTTVNCNYYTVCAKKENLGTVTTNCGGTYNFQVTPL